MRLIQADDYNDVVDIFISGAAAVDEIAPGVVRVTYFVEKVEIDGDARSRRRKIVDSQIWSVPQLADTLLVMQKALKEMRAMRGQPKLVQARGDALSDTGLAAPSLRWRRSRTIASLISFQLFAGCFFAFDLL